MDVLALASVVSYLYACTYVCMHTCMHVCMYGCIYRRMDGCACPGVCCRYLFCLVQYGDRTLGVSACVASARLCCESTCARETDR